MEEQIICLEWNLQLFAGDGDKTEESTPHRRREARRKGQVFKSVELNAAVNMLGMSLLFLALGHTVYHGFQVLLQTFLGDLFTAAAASINPGQVLSVALQHYLRLVGPVFLVALAIGLAANLSQVGFVLSGSHMAPQLNRLNPLEGLKRIFSRRALFELVKAVLKIVIIGGGTFIFVRARLDQMLLLLNQPASRGAAVFWSTIAGLGLSVGLVFVVLALMDYIFQRSEFQKSLRMSIREVKEELKHLEGDPLIRSRVREKQRLLARQRMLQDVATADVVIINPTEIAVALRYRQGEDQAPVLVAKGMHHLARRIREIAGEHNIEIVSNPPVAQMIWKYTGVGMQIPVELYQAVAEILALVFRIKGKEINP